MNLRFFLILTALFGTFFLSGCLTHSKFLGKVENDMSEVHQESPRLYHVVFCWLKDKGNKVHRQKIIEITKSFRSIPGVLEASAGQVVPSDRDIVDDSFDIGILIVTQDRKSLQEYLEHPIHQKGKNEVLIPLVDRVLVYDFEK